MSSKNVIDLILNVKLAEHESWIQYKTHLYLYLYVVVQLVTMCQIKDSIKPNIVIGIVCYE